MRKEARKHIVDIFNLNFQLTTPQLKSGKIEQILCAQPTTEKAYRNAAKRFSHKSLYEYVVAIRKRNKIIPAYFNEEREKWDKKVNRSAEVRERIERELDQLGLSPFIDQLKYNVKWEQLAELHNYNKIRDSKDQHTKELLACADKLLSHAEVEKIRITFDFPPHWANAIAHYILTNELRSPTAAGYELNYKLVYDAGTVSGLEIDIYGDTTVQYIKDLCRRINKNTNAIRQHINGSGPKFYYPFEIENKVDRFVVFFPGVPTVRDIGVAVKKCQRSDMRGSWIKQVRRGQDLGERLRAIERFEMENPLDVKYVDPATDRPLGASGRSISDPKEYARIRKIKQRTKDHRNIF